MHFNWLRFVKVKVLPPRRRAVLSVDSFRVGYARLEEMSIDIDVLDGVGLEVCRRSIIILQPFRRLEKRDRRDTQLHFSTVSR